MTDEPIQSNFFRPRIMGWFIERLTGLNVPFRIATPTHPILRLELKGIRWLQPDARARIHRMVGRRIRWTIIFALLLVIVDLLALVQRLNQNRRNYYYSGDVPSAYMLVAALLFSLLMFVVGDFYYMIRSLRAITLERESGHWDMVRLFPMSSKTILDAKFAALQLHSWRVLALEYLPRFYFLIAFVPYLLTSSLRYSSYALYNFWTWNNVIPILILTFAALIYTLEAGWRMRALTAIGLAISARSRNLMNNFIVGFFALVGVHILEAICLFVPFYIMTRARFPYVPFYNSIGFYVRSYGPVALFICAVGLLNYGLLFSLRRMAYNYALRRAFRDIQ
jgi:hypothetical protein